MHLGDKSKGRNVLGVGGYDLNRRKTIERSDKTIWDFGRGGINIKKKNSG